MKIAIIEKNKSTIDYTEYFSFEFDKYYLSSKKVKKLLVKDIDIEIDTEEYDFIILVGADATKRFSSVTSVVNYQGYLVDDKYIPISSPAMLAFKPAGKPAFDKAISDILSIIDGEVNNYNATTILIDDSDIAERYVQDIISAKPIMLALDSETSALYSRNGYVLGISITYEEDIGVYIDAECITDGISDLLQYLFTNTKVIFHNAKFDKHFFEYHFGWTFPDWEDTILLHYLLEEQPGTHGLKQLAIKYTEMGDYDRELELFKKKYCSEHKVKVGDFTYDLIPFDILGQYAAKDTIATLKLYNLFYPIVSKSTKLNWVYENLLKAGTDALIVVEDNGVPFKEEKLLPAQKDLNDDIYKLMNSLYNFKSVRDFEAKEGKVFNPNSVMHLRSVLFVYEGLPIPSKKTGKGEISTDKEVLGDLGEHHELPRAILAVRQLKKIKATYIDKVLSGLDMDGRLRTNFNLISTTSGRLSSSGKLNAQQLPRDNKIVKRCISARTGWKIISADLGTAEMYIAAVLSKDKALQDVFITGVDYHGFMAVQKFNLPCSPNEVATLYPDMRQAAKTVSFEILYKLNLREPILEKFPQLKRWLKKVSGDIRRTGYTYQFFGRKRRLPNVFSKSKGDADHEVRSGVNALVQGPSSDINLLACIDMIAYIKKHNMKALIFGLVHDSILAEVPDEEIEHYSNKLKDLMQKDRGLSLKGSPIKVDIEIGEDYSFTKL